jgi:hypothetical protein
VVYYTGAGGTASVGMIMSKGAHGTKTGKGYMEGDIYALATDHANVNSPTDFIKLSDVPLPRPKSCIGSTSSTGAGLLPLDPPYLEPQNPA